MILPTYALTSDEGPALWFLNSLTFIRATAKQTGSAFGLIEQFAPVGPASPYHVHRAEDESFYVLEGELEFVSGEQRVTRGPGSFVFLPRDVPHGFAVAGKSPARFLILTTPGGFEGFVEEMSRPATTLTLPTLETPDMAKLSRVAAKYRIEILGPLP